MIRWTGTPLAALLLLLAACGRAAVPDLPDLSAAEPQVQATITEAHRNLGREPGSAARWGHYGSVLAVHGFAAEAIGAYETAARLDPEDFRWPYLLCVRLSENDPAASLAFLERALTLNDDYVPLHLRYASMVERAGDSEAALLSYRRAVSLDPGHAYGHAALGRRLLADGELEAAKRNLDRAMALAPQGRAGLSGLAAYYRRTGDMERARSYAKRAADAALGGGRPYDEVLAGVDQLGVSSTAVLRRALALRRAGQGQEARRQLTKLLEDNPASAGARATLGELYLRDGDHAGAIEQFRAALELSGDLVAARIGLGLALAGSGRLADAIRELEKVVAAHPSSARGHAALAACRAQAGRPDLALVNFRRAFELVPDDKIPRVGYGKALYYTGDYEGALSILMPVAAERGQRLDEQTIDAIGHAGLALLMLGRGDEVPALVSVAVAAAPTRTDLRRLLAGALIGSGRGGEAVEVLNEGLRYNPRDGQLAIMLAYLLSTSPKDDVRAGDQAVRLAEQVAAATQHRDPEILRVLACAYAEVGRFREAVETTERAITVARQLGQESLVESLNAQLLEFEAGRPHRETPDQSFWGRARLRAHDTQRS